MDFNYDNYIATEEDVPTDVSALIAVGDDVPDNLIRQLPADAKARLERALATGANTDLVRSIRREYKEWIQLRLEMAADTAVDALEKVMTGRWYDEKTANAAVKASEVTLDRAGFPKVSKTISETRNKEQGQVLPSLEDIIKDADPDDISDITENYLEAVRRLDAMRAGAKEVIDVRPGVQNESQG